jgi:hypothetical protein
VAEVDLYRANLIEKMVEHFGINWGDRFDVDVLMRQVRDAIAASNSVAKDQINPNWTVETAEHVAIYRREIRKADRVDAWQREQEWKARREALK